VSRRFGRVAQAFAEVRTELAVQQARLLSDIYALLTSEQQQRLQAQREARETERRQGQSGP
jgi:Spy/CpxP family protein refolding chaperone